MLAVLVLGILATLALKERPADSPALSTTEPEPATT
jgi:hypothetical protein